MGFIFVVTSHMYYLSVWDKEISNCINEAETISQSVNQDDPQSALWNRIIFPF